MTATARNHWPTVAALAVLAMCLVTFDHEALGHGGACLVQHGRIALLTSSVFHCDLKSRWIDPWGPATNILIGGVALIAARLAPRRLAGLRLFLLLVTAFSWFWETIYLAHAMLRRDGDLYFFARDMLGEPGAALRGALGLAGLLLWLFVAKLIAGELRRLWPEPKTARSVARTAWLWATLAATLAALAVAGHDLGDIRDAALEIGGASLPLLFIPRRGARTAEEGPGASIGRNPGLILLAVAVFVLFVATLGRGISL